MSYLINGIKKLPRFEGSHCPDHAGHEYIKKVDTGRYVRLKDVIQMLENKGESNEKRND